MVKDFKKTINYLYNILDAGLRSGVLEKQSYDVGIQIMAVMVKRRSLRVEFTWAELMQYPVLGKNMVVATTASDLHFYHYGALQQLQQLVGIVSHTDVETLNEQVAIYKDWQRENPAPPNFTGEPGTPSLVLMPDTVVHCEYVEIGSDPVENRITNLYHTACYTLPTWATASRR